MNIQVDGTFTLPEGMTEDQFNTLFLTFVEENKIQFFGITAEEEKKNG